MLGVVDNNTGSVRKGKISKNSPTSTALGTPKRAEMGVRMGAIANRIPVPKVAAGAVTEDLAKQNEGILASLGLDTFLRPLKKKTDTLG